MNCYLIDQEIIFCHHVQINDFITCFQVGTRIITFNPLFSHLVLELQHITFGSHWYLRLLKVQKNGVMIKCLF